MKCALRQAHADHGAASKPVPAESQAAPEREHRRRRKPTPSNCLLAALPGRNRSQFLANCDHVELNLATVLSEFGERIRHVYFPTNSFISLVTTLDDGARLEVGIVGNEGMLGIPLLLGVNVSSQHALVQGAGAALRMTAARFLDALDSHPQFRQQLNRYAHVLMGQLAQTAACTHYHLIEARLARWLLLTRDRAHRDRFHLTHEFLAYMLGVRRVGITRAASALYERGLISYVRGEITILDVAGLQRASCGCYEQGNRTYEQALGRG